MMSSEPLDIEKQKSDPEPGRKSPMIASLAALASVILSSSCCLPLVPFLAAAGAAGASAFLVKIRPFLLIASLLFIAFGFYQAWRAKRCNRRSSLLSTILLWLSAVVVLSSILFPQVLANLVANVLGGS
jgi:cytochrome bd-type quinol oxidase subunit 2